VGHRLGKAAVAGPIPARGSKTLGLDSDSKTFSKAVNEFQNTAYYLEKYLKSVNLEQFFRELGASDPRKLAEEAAYFTSKEAEKRDQIVKGYFGQAGINQIVKTVVDRLLEKPALPVNARILDVGAGTGFFTLRIAEKVQAKLPEASFYAMDLTPAMLLALNKKNANVTPFLGIAENIKGSIKKAKDYAHIPDKFDAIISTLMLHHSTSPERVFESVKTVLKRNGKAIILDLCEHGFEEFRTEMGDLHLGFKPKDINKMAGKHFSTIKTEKMPGIKCTCSGRGTEIFVTTMLKRLQKRVK
jgi:SAM-dependent methyltransferase